MRSTKTFVGGKEGNKHAEKKLHVGGGTGGKIPVIGMRERDGRVIAKPIDSVTNKRLRGEIERKVKEGTLIYTDEHGGYNNLPKRIRMNVRHSAGEYVGPNSMHTSSIESVWAVLKRGLYGGWHKASYTHLHRRVNEATLRFNDTNVKVHTLNRVASFAAKSFTARITSRDLTA